MTPEDNPQWEYREEFKIHARMKEVVRLTISAAEAELAAARRKLEKLSYGG